MKIFSNIRNKKSNVTLKDNDKSPIKKNRTTKRNAPITPLRKIENIWQEKIPSKVNFKDKTFENSIFKTCKNYGECLEVILNFPPRQKAPTIPQELKDFFKLQTDKLKETLSELPETIGQRDSIETISEHISDNLSSELSDTNKFSEFLKKITQKKDKDTNKVKISGIDSPN